MSATYEHFKGKFIHVTQIDVKPGVIDEFLPLVLQARDHARSDAEPGCLRFDISRSGNSLAGYGEWADAGALKYHWDWVKDKFEQAQPFLEKHTLHYYELVD